MKPLPDLIKSAKRELALRERNYPKWIGASLTADQARHEIQCMQDIITTLEQINAKAQPELFAGNPNP